MRKIRKKNYILRDEEGKFYFASPSIVGRTPIGHLTNSSAIRAKVAIKMVMI